MNVTFTLNGKEITIDYEEGMNLLEVLREICQIKSCKDGCSGQGACVGYVHGVQGLPCWSEAGPDRPRGCRRGGRRGPARPRPGGGSRRHHAPVPVRKVLALRRRGLRLLRGQLRLQGVREVGEFLVGCSP